MKESHVVSVCYEIIRWTLLSAPQGEFKRTRNKSEWENWVRHEF